MLMICLKYRIYPTNAQEATLNNTLAVCRDVYNSLLNQREAQYEIDGNSPSMYEQMASIAKWKANHAELKTVNAQVLQNIAVRVDRAYKAFFRRVKAGGKPGFPRKKGYGCYDSVTFPQYPVGCALRSGSIIVSKIGAIKAIIHRPLIGTPKTCTIRRQSGKWFACYSCEYEPVALPNSDEQIGIDVGLNQFASLSNGKFIANPRFFRKEEKALAKAQRQQAKTKKCGPERRKRNKVLSRIHERVRNRRHNFVHQTARRIVNQYGVIAVEKLKPSNMSRRPAPIQDETTGEFLPNGASQKAGLNKSIQDAAWSMFRTVLTQKAESAGRIVIAVNPAYTSQDCSGCGYRAKKPLKVRWHNCPMCGLSLDRDTNAAINILALGQQSIVGIPA